MTTTAANLFNAECINTIQLIAKQVGRQFFTQKKKNVGRHHFRFFIYTRSMELMQMCSSSPNGKTSFSLNEGRWFDSFNYAFSLFFILSY